jgi:hypothetical protein
VDEEVVKKVRLGARQEGHELVRGPHIVFFAGN